MTFFEKLAEKVGIKKAIQSMYSDCPCDYFIGLNNKFCPGPGHCSSCWSEDWNGQGFRDTDKEAVIGIYLGDIVAVETPGGFRIGRVKKVGEYIDVWIDKTNIPATVEKRYVHKIVNAYLITDDLIGGSGEGVEEGIKDACEV